MYKCFLVPLFQNECSCDTDLHENESVVRSHMNDFAVLTQKQNTTRKISCWMNVVKVVEYDTHNEFVLTNIQTAFMKI